MISIDLVANGRTEQIRSPEGHWILQIHFREVTNVEFYLPFFEGPSLN